MALKARKAEVWVVSIDDRAGGVADKLELLAKAGANFEMVFARRTPENPGKGMMFVTPVKGAKVTRAAREAGMGTPPSIHTVRIEGADRLGLGAKIARALGDAGISFRGISGIAIGRRFVSYVACDSAEDQAKAIAVLKKLK
jgi:predicted amino acid-binding ACT domain protein